MTTQPEALRLADALRDGTYLLMLERNATEAELRRLHEENKAMSDTSSQIIADNMRLHEANQAMLAALKRIAAIELQMYGADWDEIKEAQSIAIAAIAKGEQQ